MIRLGEPAAAGHVMMFPESRTDTRVFHHVGPWKAVPTGMENHSGVSFVATPQEDPFEHLVGV